MFIVYIHNPFWELITQIFNISNLKINKKLNDISSASFEIPTKDKNCTYNNFMEFNKISIFISWDNEEKLLFSWVVRDVDPDLEKTKIDLSDDLFLLRKKKLYSDKNYVNISIKNILTEILGEINSRKDTWIILNCDIEELVSVEYKDGKNFLDILKDLSQKWYEFNLENNVLIFQKTIGADKTTWSKFIEILYDIDNMQSNTIISASMPYSADNIVNAVTVKGNWSSEDATSMNTFTRIEEQFTSWDKDVILSERKDSVKELSITPSTNDFFLANIWDLVKVYINSWSDLLFYDWNLKIIEKEFVSWDLNRVKIKLSTGKIKTLWLPEKLSEMNSRINNLEL